MQASKTPWAISLDEADVDSIHSQVKAAINMAVDDVKQKAAYNSDWLKGKKEPESTSIMFQNKSLRR